jgi:hypothetical protein
LAAPAKISGAALRNRIGAEIVPDHFLYDDGEAEGDEDLVGMRALVEMLDQAAFHDDAHHRHDDDGKDDRQRHRPVEQELADLGAEPALRDTESALSADCRESPSRVSLTRSKRG